MSTKSRRIIALVLLLSAFFILPALATQNEEGPQSPVEPTGPVDSTDPNEQQPDISPIPAVGEGSTPGITIGINGIETPQGTADTLQILFLLTVLSLAPSILLMMTGFTRIIVVLSMTRTALGLQQTPPNQVLIGLALFLTLFLMMPILQQINEEAYTPFGEGLITQEEAIDRSLVPLREFMFKQIYPEDLNLFLSLADQEMPEALDEIATEVVIPAFIVSELKRAFIIGFVIMIPFLIIDIVVSSTLMSMGMMMLPPAMISLPFKLLLFILVDGWGLIAKTLFQSFSG